MHHFYKINPDSNKKKLPTRKTQYQGVRKNDILGQCFLFIPPENIRKPEVQKGNIHLKWVKNTG